MVLLSLMRRSVRRFCAERIPIPFVPFVSLDVQKKQQIIREHRKTRKFHDASAVQAAVGVVVVGALHDAVLPHDAQRKNSQTPKLLRTITNLYGVKE